MCHSTASAAPAKMLDVPSPDPMGNRDSVCSSTPPSQVRASCSVSVPASASSETMPAQMQAALSRAHGVVG